jgi:hypothetical protein
LTVHDDGTAELQRPGKKPAAFELPVRAGWTLAASRDPDHLVLFGSCSVLLETTDGGRSWSARPSPAPLTTDLFWRGDELWLVDFTDAYRRNEPLAAFDVQPALTTHCAAGRSPGTVVFACPFARRASALLRAVGSGPLEPLPGPPDSRLISLGAVTDDSVEVLTAGRAGDGIAHRWRWTVDHGREELPRR